TATAPRPSRGPSKRCTVLLLQPISRARCSRLRLPSRPPRQNSSSTARSTARIDVLAVPSIGTLRSARASLPGFNTHLALTVAESYTVNTPLTKGLTAPTGPGMVNLLTERDVVPRCGTLADASRRPPEFLIRGF